MFHTLPCFSCATSCPSSSISHHEAHEDHEVASSRNFVFFVPFVVSVLFAAARRWALDGRYRVLVCGLSRGAAACPPVNVTRRGAFSSGFRQYSDGIRTKRERCRYPAASGASSCGGSDAVQTRCFSGGHRLLSGQDFSGRGPTRPACQNAPGRGLAFVRGLRRNGPAGATEVKFQESIPGSHGRHDAGGTLRLRAGEGRGSGTAD